MEAVSATCVFLRTNHAAFLSPCSYGCASVAYRSTKRRGIAVALEHLYRLVRIMATSDETVLRAGAI